MTGRRSAALGVAAALMQGSAGRAFALESDEGVIVTPSTARRLDNGSVELRVQAWVYERDSRRLATRALAAALGLDFDELDPADRARFVERTQLFAREAQARRRLRLRLHESMPWIDLPASRRDGSVDATLPLPTRVVGRDLADGATLAFDLAAGVRRFAGRAQVHGGEGLSVVSDIDDTIKHTQVRDRRQMLANTFVRPFTAVPGMSAWYARIAAAQPTAFHFVSSGPWALASALEAFVSEHAFPPASLHLRAFSLKPQALMSKSASPAHKHATIERLLADQPRRRFVLIGDTGEQDPEIYGAIARRHAGRIAATLVRDVTGEAPDGERLRAAFDQVPRARWSTFDDPADLPTRWD